MAGDFWFAILVSGLAAAATAAGSLVSLVVRRPGPGFMAFSLGFSAGVMMLVSFAELLRESIDGIGFGWAMVAFFAGMGIMFLVDVCTPHEFIGEHGDAKVCDEQVNALLRTGLLLAIGIGIHNLPEGMATFAGALKNRGLGVAVASAIALHNIPEGIAVAIPVYCATGSRRKALLWSSSSGVAELAGALIAAAVLMPFLTADVLNVTLAAVAGLMTFISFDELIPGSYAYRREHMSVAGVVAGMMLMSVSLWLLR
ncbi:zinc transporter ZupT [candidate division WOR-3 bacterium]|nr:zinc transporter ZupT [candidate division WOR-3 bacterium]